MQSEAVPAPCVRCVAYQLLSESRARLCLSLATLVLITTVSVRGRLQLRFDRAGGLADEGAALTSLRSHPVRKEASESAF